MANTQNQVAKSFKALHIPSQPLILANIHDAASAKAVSLLPASKAIATGSYAIAECAGTTDENLTLEELIWSAKSITSAIKSSGKPLTVDVRDGYGNQLEIAIKDLIKLGVVGVNLEDFDNESKKMYSAAEAARRIQIVLNTAQALGVPDFVVNARCDSLLNEGNLDDVIERGRTYLDAGATSVFVWGGSIRKGITQAEVVQLVRAFEGRLNVLLKSSDGLSAKELATIGVSRISIGPALLLAAVAKMKDVAQELLEY